ncbi:hypothetical protein [Sphingobacterium suaedae]|uniref:Uncharacterized protein n=1 Tax=Sphingobacterium suaedae TaxID=1686402 RepID=A0ABW5KLX9_9SPHI
MKTNFLKEKECSQAIDAWNSMRLKYEHIIELIDPRSGFKFEKGDCQELLKDSSDYFHAYFGVHHAKVILIAKPLDENGKERKLSKYVYVPYAPMENNLAIIEIDTVTTTKTTILTPDLKISKLTKEIDLPTSNEPLFPEEICVQDIELWKDNCLDWFFRECSEYGGKGIFRFFRVPTVDLAIKGTDYTAVQALFGLKFSMIYQKSYPALIFVSTKDPKTALSEPLVGSEIFTPAVMNSKDYSQPCPPFCKDMVLERNTW